MQLKKNSSSISNFTSKNIQDQQLIEKAIKYQLQTFTPAVTKAKSTQVQVIIRNSPSKFENEKQKKIKIDIIQEEENKMKLKIGKKHLLNFFPVYTTLLDSDSLKQSKSNEQVLPYLQQGENAKQPELLDQKIMADRKKLSPLRRTKNEKKSEQKQKTLHISFLSVQKAPFLKQDQKSNDKNSMTITTSGFNKNKLLMSRRSFQGKDNQNTEIHRQAYKQYFTKVIANRPILAPFDKYHYYDFIWKVGFSNGLRLQFPDCLSKKYKAYVGVGNNSNLIKTLLKRRSSWWILTDKMEEANFIWTQTKVGSVFASQKSYLKTGIHPVQIQKQKQSSKTTLIYKKHKKIMNDLLVNEWIDYYYQNKHIQEKITPTFQKRNRIISKKVKLSTEQPDKLKVHNHLPRNFLIGNKKALFSTMKRYYESCNKKTFDYLPLTFHVQKGVDDPQYYSFLKVYYNKEKQKKLDKKKSNIWIIKPGQFTNRGNGITVCHSIQQIKSILRNRVKLQNGDQRTYIIQEYLEKPFLYCGRKFDIRHYMLITSINGHTKGYWCQLGYIRTTSYEYSLNKSSNSVHLTNDAVQKLLPEYGKYQRANKLSYEQFQNYLKTEHLGKFSFYKDIYPQMKNVAYDSMKASGLFLDPERKGHNFEIFGFDFMIDANFHPWLIQINTNPCLQLNCPVLNDVIPQMIQNAFKIGLDSIFPPPQSFEQKRPRFNNNILQQNIFQLLYDSSIQEREISKLLGETNQSTLNIVELEKDVEEVYQNDGILLED